MVNESSGYAVGDGGLILKRDSVLKNVQPKQRVTIKLYPNPAIDKATISFNLEKETKIAVQVADANGNIILKQAAKTFDKGEQQIILVASKLQRGTYLVNLLEEGTVIGSSRLIIVR
jgi:hypothetical protein